MATSNTLTFETVVVRHLFHQLKIFGVGQRMGSKRMEQKVCRSVEGETMQLCLCYVRWHKSPRETTLRYIYIGVSQRRVDAVLRKRAGAILNANEVLWPHDVRICVAIRKIPLSQAVLQRLSFISIRLGGRKDYITFVQRGEKSPGYV